jgi:DNA adenine methylase
MFVYTQNIKLGFKMNCKPFIKWVGGKRQLINEIKNNLPAKYNNYFEPFVGAGSVIFSLYDGKRIFNINDFNADLVNLYNVVKNTPEDLINRLDVLSNKIDVDSYNEIRSIDRDLSKFLKLTPVEKASRFIYLNKTCFNGLYRVNSSNQFNVPFAKDKEGSNVSLYDKSNILSASNLLKNVNITCGDFENLKQNIKKDDFVYLDPPYIPLSETSSFTSYTARKNETDAELQIRLKYFCDHLNNIGAKFLLSNSSSPIAIELYKDYEIIKVDARRSINRDGKKRGKIKEIMVKNY